MIGQTLAMEGVFSFFLESSFLGLFLYGEKRLGPKGHWFAAFMVFLGSWMSGYLIVVTDAWMQHPVAYQLGPHGEFILTSFWGLLLNPWDCPVRGRMYMGDAGGRHRSVRHGGHAKRLRSGRLCEDSLRTTPKRLFVSAC